MPNYPMCFDPKDMSAEQLLEWFDKSLSLTEKDSEDQMTAIKVLYHKEALYQFYAASWVKRQVRICEENELALPWETEEDALKFLRLQGDLGGALKIRLAPEIINALTSTSLSEIDTAIMKKLCQRVGVDWPPQKPVLPVASAPRWGWSLLLLRCGLTSKNGGHGHPKMFKEEAERIMDDLGPVELSESDTALLQNFRKSWEGRIEFRFFNKLNEEWPTDKRPQKNEEPSAESDRIRPSMAMNYDPNDLSAEQLLEWLSGDLSFLGSTFNHDEKGGIEKDYIKDIIYHYLSACWIDLQIKLCAEKGQPLPWETKEGAKKFLACSSWYNSSYIYTLESLECHSLMQALKARLAPYLINALAPKHEDKSNSLHRCLKSLCLNTGIEWPPQGKVSTTPKASPPSWGLSLQLLRTNFDKFDRISPGYKSQRIMADLLMVDLNKQDAALFKTFCQVIERRHLWNLRKRRL